MDQRKELIDAYCDMVKSFANLYSQWSMYAIDRSLNWNRYYRPYQFFRNEDGTPKFPFHWPHGGE